VRTTWVATTRGMLALYVLVALVGGCSRKAPSPTREGVGEPGVGEEGLAPGSLDRARKGLGPAEGGPLADVHFEYDSYDLTEAARGVLEQNLVWLRDNPRAKVELEGHCDSRGTIEYNLGLGARRAKAVQDYLVTQGTGAERLSTISYGKELPLCHEDTEECWARNRRAHSVVLGQ
jgi:peptidoglycan-associated lipoprotein